MSQDATHIHVLGGNPHPNEQLFDPPSDLRAFRKLMDFNRFPDHTPHRQTWIQGAVRVLENDLHPFSEASQRGALE